MKYVFDDLMEVINECKSIVNVGVNRCYNMKLGFTGKKYKELLAITEGLDTFDEKSVVSFELCVYGSSVKISIEIYDAESRSVSLHSYLSVVTKVNENGKGILVCQPFT